MKNKIVNLAERIKHSDRKNPPFVDSGKSFHLIMNSMISGIVVNGNKIGKTLGFPTANLDTKDHGLPMNTVHCGKAKFNGNEYNMVLCVNWENTIEVHLLDYEGEDFYGARFNIYDLQFMRSMDKIDDVELLKEAISKDIDNAKKLLNI